MPTSTTEEQTGKLTLSDKLRRLKGLITGAAIWLVVVAVIASIPHLRPSLVWLPLYLSASLVSAVFAYLRAIHPDRVPPMLTLDAPLVVELKRIKRIIGWSMFAWLIAGILAVGLTCSCDGNVSIRESFILAIACGPPVLGVMAWSPLGQYIRERTVVRVSSGKWPVARRNPADYKPFYSEHWGHPRTQPTDTRAPLATPSLSSQLRSSDS